MKNFGFMNTHMHLLLTWATAEYTLDWGERGAALAISVLPILIIFAGGSKYFIMGLSAGAIKG